MPFYADPTRFTAPVWQTEPAQGMLHQFLSRNMLELYIYVTSNRILKYLGSKRVSKA